MQQVNTFFEKLSIGEYSPAGRELGNIPQNEETLPARERRGLLIDSARERNHHN